MKASILSAALFVASVSAQSFVINTPVPNPPVCQPVMLNWSGGQGPYFLVIRDGNSGQTVETIGTVNGNSFRWIADQPVGTSLGLDIRDQTGTLAQSGNFQIAAGGDPSCVGQNPNSSAGGSSSTTGAAPGSSTAGATSSGTVSVTTSTSVSVTSQTPSPSASVTAPGTSSSAAGTAGATTASGSSTRATSSTASASGSNASAPASSSQASSAKSFAEMSAAGVLGAVAVALFA